MCHKIGFSINQDDEFYFIHEPFQFVYYLLYGIRKQSRISKISEHEKEFFRRMMKYD